MGTMFPLSFSFFSFDLFDFCFSFESETTLTASMTLEPRKQGESGEEWEEERERGGFSFVVNDLFGHSLKRRVGSVASSL